MILVEASNPGLANTSVRLEKRRGLDGNPVERLIIEGYALVCDIPGINGREYPLDIITREVERLQREAVPFGRLAAELNHPRLDPEGNCRDYPICEINMSKLCAVVEELRMEGNRVFCRMVVTDQTTAGHDLAGALRGGFIPGYSIRGAGDTIPKGDHEVITDNYTLITIDVVGMPSFGNAALVTPHVESASSVPGTTSKVMLESVNVIRKEIARSYGNEIHDVGYREYPVGEFIRFAYGKV